MSRIKSVDTVRTVAIMAVVAIHTMPFQLPSSPIGHTLDLATVINQLARFAVPFFFVLSGYFWAQKFQGEKGVPAATARTARRIAFLFVGWSIIYLFPMNVWDLRDGGVIGVVKMACWNFINALHRPQYTLMEGTKAHLWFLVSLLWSVLISGCFLRLGCPRLLAVLAVLLYGVGLAGKAYADTPLGFHADFNFRNGPFFALIFFVTGYFLQRRQARAAWLPLGMGVAAVGASLHFTELVLLRDHWGTDMGQDYVLGTYFYGLGIALMALSNTRFLALPFLASIGPLVMGIYASHYAFVEFLSPLDRLLSGNASWEVLHVVIVFSLAWALAWSLSRFQLTRKLVA